MCFSVVKPVFVTVTVGITQNSLVIEITSMKIGKQFSFESDDISAFISGVVVIERTVCDPVCITDFFHGIKSPAVLVHKYFSVLMFLEVFYSFIER